VGYAREGAKTLQDLGGVFFLEQIYGEEAVVGLQGDGWFRDCGEKLRDVFHLYEGHGRFFGFELHAVEERHESTIHKMRCVIHT
jgi:hypothetical protein